MMVLANKKQMGGMVTSPSMCTFWCAVALGALIKGVPIESVGHCVGCRPLGYPLPLRIPLISFHTRNRFRVQCLFSCEVRWIFSLDISSIGIISTFAIISRWEAISAWRRIVWIVSRGHQRQKQSGDSTTSIVNNNDRLSESLSFAREIS